MLLLLLLLPLLLMMMRMMTMMMMAMMVIINIMLPLRMSVLAAGWHVRARESAAAPASPIAFPPRLISMRLRLA